MNLVYYVALRLSPQTEDWAPPRIDSPGGECWRRSSDTSQNAIALSRQCKGAELSSRASDVQAK